MEIIKNGKPIYENAESKKDVVLTVAPNGRYFIDQNGKPFFYLADTAWTLFKRLDRREVDEYLTNRSAKGFNVIQAYVLRGLEVKNVYGHVPLMDGDPTRLDEGFFENVDFIVNRANELGLVMGLVTTFGEHVRRRKDTLERFKRDEQIFNAGNAFVFGKLLGSRYKNNCVIWLLGGDRIPVEDMDIWDNMARGLKEGCEGRHLVSFHGPGGTSSSYWFQSCDWLDFNTIQSGHAWAIPNYLYVEHDYKNVIPVKPTLDMESRYENHPDRGTDGDRIIDAHQVREAAYWTVLAGAAGHGYGCNDVWQLHDRNKVASVNDYTFPLLPPSVDWQDAMDSEGAYGMGYLRKLMEEYPWYKMIPDQTVLAKGQGSGEDHVQSARAEDGSFIVAYLPFGNPVSIHMDRLTADTVKSSWYNPRNGEYTYIGTHANSGVYEFVPPSSGMQEDWVLVLEGE